MPETMRGGVINLLMVKISNCELKITQTICDTCQGITIQFLAWYLKQSNANACYVMLCLTVCHQRMFLSTSRGNASARKVAG